MASLQSIRFTNAQVPQTTRIYTPSGKADNIVLGIDKDFVEENFSFKRITPDMMSPRTAVVSIPEDAVLVDIMNLYLSGEPFCSKKS